MLVKLYVSLSMRYVIQHLFIIYIRIASLVWALWTHKWDELMATLVNREWTYWKNQDIYLTVAECVEWNGVFFTLTLEALDTKAPDEVFAMAAEGRLLEEALNELVLLNHSDGLLTHGTSPIKLLGICLEALLTTLSTLGQTTRFVLVLCRTSLVHNECEVWRTLELCFNGTLKVNLKNRRKISLN